MPDEPQHIADAPEQKAASQPVPVWMLVLLLLLVFWGMAYFDQHSGWADSHVYMPYRSMQELTLYQPATGGGNLALGKQYYDNVCGLCHNPDGAGKPGQAPPFVGSEFVLGSPARLIRIPQVGLTGPVQVKGQDYNNLPSMAAMGATLTDEQLAAVLTYMRQSWGNKAKEITADEVKAVRKEVGNRAQPWTVQEVNAFQ
jgi:mono/diheme cytochrome c family protein